MVTNVVKIMGFTTFPKIMLLKPLKLYIISKNNVAKPLVLQHFQKHVARTIVFQTFPKTRLQNHWFYNISKNNVGRAIGFTTFPNIVLLESLVLQHVQT